MQVNLNNFTPKRLTYAVTFFGGAWVEHDVVGIDSQLARAEVWNRLTDAQRDNVESIELIDECVQQL